MPNSDEEIVVDKMVLDDLIASDYNYTYAKMAGLTETQDFINLEVYQNNDYTYKIVGISDLGSPCIYAKESSLINIIYDTYSYDSEELTYKDYNFADLTLKKGTLPLNDYEAVINYNQKDSYPIGKKLENKINGKELKVVGYYTSSEDSNLIYVNSNMIKYDLINKSSAVTISADNKEEVISELNDNNINAKDLYNVSKNEYIKEKKSSVKSVIIFSSIIIAISLIEILLMIRSSFLSRIKEVGIYRAIGVKKSDIYKMFLGEILAISLTASLGGVLLMSYILINVSKIKYLSDLFVINIKIVILAYLICLVFNIVIGLLPVASTIRKRPAQILARNDI
jgi:ABC-type antimicrobial peptide transport system permease subunit